MRALGKAWLLKEKKKRTKNEIRDFNFSFISIYTLNKIKARSAQGGAAQGKCGVTDVGVGPWD